MLRCVKSPTLKWDLPIPGVKLFQMCKRAFGHNISSGKEGTKIHLSGIVVMNKVESIPEVETRLSFLNS